MTRALVVGVLILTAPACKPATSYTPAQVECWAQLEAEEDVEIAACLRDPDCTAEDAEAILDRYEPLVTACVFDGAAGAGAGAGGDQ